MKKIFILSLISFFLFASNAFAGKRYWVAPTAAYWNNTANWSASSGGGSGASVPGSTDTAYFDGALISGTANYAIGNDTLDVNINIKYLSISAGYTGVIIQGTKTVTIGTSGAVLSGGTFSGGSATISISGILTLSGCAFTSTSGTLNMTGNFTKSSGSFTHNSGTFKLSGNSARSHSGSATFNVLEITNTANGTTVTVNSGTTFTTKDFKITGANQLTLNGAGAISVTGDIYNSNTYLQPSSSPVVTVNGTGPQHFYGPTSVTGFQFPSLVVNKSSDSLHLHNYVIIKGDLTRTSGVIDAGSSTVILTGSPTVTGTFSLNRLNLSASDGNNHSFTFASGTSVTVDTVLYLGYHSGSGGFLRVIGPGAIHAHGSVSVATTTNVTAYAGTPAVIHIDGAGNQTLTGNGTAGTGMFPGFTINKSSGSLTLANKITVAGNWTYTAGTLSLGTSTVCFTGTKTITGSHTLKNVTFHGTASVSTVHTITIASGTTLTVDSTLVVSGTNGIDLNTGNIHAKGNLTFSNTSNFGGGTATLTINGTSGNQTFTGNSTALDGQVPNVVINKTSDTLKLVSIISCPGNWTYTAGIINPGTSTVYFVGANTITGSHTLYHVTKMVGQALTIGSSTTLTVNGTFTVTGNNICQINDGTIACKGNITVTNTGSTGNGDGTILINGTGDQTFTGATTAGQGRLQNITINKPSGTLYLVNHIFCIGNWTYTAGTIDAGTSTVHYRLTGMTLSGTHSLYSVTFYGDATAFTYNISGTLTVNGTLSFNGTGTITMNAGTIHAKGHIATTNTGTSTGGSTSIIINGTGNQTLTGSGTAGGGKLPNINVDKSTGTLTLASIISVAGAWTYTQGTVSPGTSTVAFYNSANLDGQETGTTNCMSFYNITINGGTRTLTGHLDCNNNFTIASGATCSAGANKIYVGGDWNSVGTWTYATSTVVFDGTGHNKIKGTGTVNFYNVTVNRSYSAGAPRSVKLQNPMQVNSVMILQKGRVITDATNYLAFPDNAVVTLFNDDSAYVCGPVRKTGDDPFKFPLGDTLLHDSIAFHPMDITAPSNISDRFEAQYYAVGQTVGDSLVDSLTNLSEVEYWRLDRQVGSSNIMTTLYWNANSTNVEDYNNLRVANWNNAKWLDLGGTNITVSNRTGSVTAVTPPTYVSNSALLTISNQVTGQAYAVLHRKLDGGYYLVKNGALYFMYDEEYNDADDNLSFTIYDEQRRTVASSAGTYAIAETSDYGDNRFYINLFDCSTNANGSLGSGTYILEVSNEKGEKWLLRFKHVTTITPNCPGGGGGGQ